MTWPAAPGCEKAAMALRLAMSLDTYEYRPGVQHAQSPMKHAERDIDIDDGA